MVVYVKQSIGLGAVPNDDTGDDLRVGGDKINDNFDEIFGAITFEAVGPKAITFDGTGKSLLASLEIFSGTVVNASSGNLALKMGRMTGSLVSGTDCFLAVQDTGGPGVTSGDLLYVARTSVNASHRWFGNSTPQELMSLTATGVLTTTGDIDPKVTETLDLGSPTFEWNNLFLQNAVTVSDARRKNDIDSAAALIPVMKLLNPRLFSFKSKTVKEAIPEKIGKREKTKIVKEQKIEIIDGIPIVITVDVEKPIFKMVTIKDKNGNSVKGPDGKVLKHPVPDMENYTIPAEEEIVVSHGRPHTGFMAQDVKKAMNEAGVKDWAGYAYHNEKGEDTHILRLLEFISPMLAYIQELEGRIKKLEVA